MEEVTVNQMAQAMGRMTNASIMMAGGLEKVEGDARAADALQHNRIFPDGRADKALCI